MPSRYSPLRLITRLAAALAALAAIAVAVWHLSSASAGVAITRTQAGKTPVTLFNFTQGSTAPIVVIAHGFAGSQQIMQPFALTLARNGYQVATFDFLGHGRNPVPMSGDITKDTGVTPLLVAELGRVMDFVRAGSSSRLALLGHSMATDIIVRYAKAHPEVQATVAVSMFSPGVEAASPRNLLVIVGASEPQFLKDEALRAAGMQAGGPASPQVTYGSFADGTARRASFSQGVEHIGVLYSAESLREAADWLGQVFDRPPAGFIDARGAMLGLLFAGLIALAWPLAALLPRLVPQPAGAGLTWRRLLPMALGPAVLTPLILWKLPVQFLPILLGDYLTAHLAIYGLLTLAALCWQGAPAPPRLSARNWVLFAVVIALVAAWSILAIGLAIDLYVTSFMPVPARWKLIPAIMMGTIPYFLADEWLTHGVPAPRGAAIFTKLCLLLSLAAAVALNFERLFFLIIIIPAMLVFLTVYGLFSRWACQRTGHPLAAGAGNGFALAWAIAVTFPLFANG